MKKAASLVMAAAMAATCVSALPEMPVKAAQVNFTHEEWTGKNGAEDIFAVNREAASVDPVPFQDAASAAAAVWEYNERENSDYLQMLTGSGGDWDLRVVQNAEQAQGVFMSGFANADFYPDPADGWRSVSLPNSWTAQGFDFPIYDNVIMPWQSNYDGYVPCPTAPTKYNPVGLYRKKFTPDSSILSSGRRVYIQFDGVESAYYVYLNGKAVGYSEDTFSPHRFDITDYLTEGENTLAVEVHKFCDGTWFEGQDMIYDGGIFRDVFLVSAPEVQIRDYTVRTDLNDSFTAAELTVDAEIANFSGSDKSGWSVTADAYDETGELLFSGASAEIGNVSRGGKTAVKISANVDSPKLWSAEHPNIYALILTLRDSFGNEQEVLSTQLGFREIGFTPTQVD
ncbi:MAG: glycoside hydrolase family 2, partial [Ruminococcus sp.]|nr:glycoside hydrolase family 2 [Ruminococcus sp.]